MFLVQVEWEEVEVVAVESGEEADERKSGDIDEAAGDKDNLDNALS